MSDLDLNAGRYGQSFRLRPDSVQGDLQPAIRFWRKGRDPTYVSFYLQGRMLSRDLLASRQPP